MPSGEPLLGTTLFPITGLSSQRFRFRILAIKERLPADSRLPTRIQKLASLLWKTKLRCPVYPSSHRGSPIFLIPDTVSPSPGTIVEVQGVPDLTYHIEVTPEVREIAVGEARPEERDLVSRMVERAFTERFLSMTGRYWQSEWTAYFRKLPENAGSIGESIDAFRGLKFGVTFLSDGSPFFAGDVRTHYIGRRPLSDCGPDELAGSLADHVDLDKPFRQRANFVRDNGNRKIACKFAGETGRTIGEFRISDLGQSVFEYYRTRYAGVPVQAEDKAVFVQDGEEGQTLPVPASRLFPVFGTDYEGVRNCSVKAQLTPRERVSFLTGVIQGLGEVTYETSRLIVSDKFYTTRRTVFAPPSLEFGGGRRIRIDDDSPERPDEDFDSRVTHWGLRKIPSLYRWGPFHLEPVPDAILFYPETFERPIRESLLTRLGGEISQQSKGALRVVRQNPYHIGKGERGGQALLTGLREIAREGGRVLVIVLLWDGFHDRVHGDIKEILSSQPSQCLTEAVARDIVAQSSNRSVTRLRNLSLAVLTETGSKPWVLGAPLHNDVHVGIDVLWGRVGYNFLYAVGGRDVFRESGWATQRGRTVEAVKRPEMTRAILSGLKRIQAHSGPIGSLAVHRDGRWWPTESEGLREAVRRAQELGLLKPDFHYTVVELKKHHAPIRLFTASTPQGAPELRNPLPGTYFQLDGRRAIMTTTGRPGSWEGAWGRTAGTLLVQVAETNAAPNVRAVAEDIYALTHLNWASPDIEISLPVTIRWADSALRETLKSSDDIGGDEDSEDEESEQDSEVSEAG